MTTPDQREEPSQSAPPSTPLQPPQTAPEPAVPQVLLRVGPSAIVLAGSFLIGLLLIAVGVLMIAYPIEPGTGESFGSKMMQFVARYKWAAGLAVIAVVVIWLAVKIIILKSVLYTITTERIERERGVFHKTTDNLDFWRVNDVQLQRSLMDRMLGIGSIVVMSSDQTDPRFLLYKVNSPKDVYDIVKRVSVQADRRRGVLHVEP